MFYLIQVFVMIEDDIRIQISHISCDGKEAVVLLVPVDLLLIKRVFLLLVILRK
ncbi:hypothetical protein LX99_04581 [Mucilaginibacter oryzae]|uniref:Uncharacterized protein n=1 Tax=Mucilaginibacter oryzae TaxID=468058 RepID=A0A316HFT3_9SPHI|nr:hypothetical protein [Mucilaginibacter oryzae]PWK70873.1 hypothetical protein LX99_04581 [Mucilaginibacter oryzae]